VRFDDTLDTVLAADFSTPFGMASAWRQLVDLIGRRRAPAEARALSILRQIRTQVPPPVRAASARGLELADPPAALVKLLAVDEIAVAAPVLRSARMASGEWVALLPELSPAARAVLRHRRDLSPAVRRALESFGPIDFVLPDDSRPAMSGSAAVADAAIVAEPAVTSEPVTEPEPAPLVPSEPDFPPIVIRRPAPREDLVDWTEVIAARPPAPEERPQPTVHELVDRLKQREREAEPETGAAEVDFSFVALAGGIDLVNAEVTTNISQDTVQSGTSGDEIPGVAVELNGEPGHGSDMKDDEFIVAETPATGTGRGGQVAGNTPQSFVPQSTPQVAPVEGPFEIADVVARIDAFWSRQQDEPVARRGPRPAEPATDFRFETDSKGLIRWVDGVSRAPIVGLSLELQGLPGGSRVDGIAAGAFRRRAGFSNARLHIEGESDAAGDWLISGIPVFDPANGRFTGYRGTARRPRVDERAEPSKPEPRAAADSLRQLVHELRTPTNAIAGFAEMIETQMLGPVADTYRSRANVIREQARDLLGAIDDLDLAARIESAALSLSPARVGLRGLLAEIADDLAQLAQLRGSWIALPVEDLAVSGDRRAVERLLARLMATLVSASGPGERVGVRTVLEGKESVLIAIDRPRALADYEGESMLGIDDETGDASLLGTGFALRLARNLARELGGSLVIEADSLTLRLPAAEIRGVEQAHLN